MLDYIHSLKPQWTPSLPHIPASYKKVTALAMGALVLVAAYFGLKKILQYGKLNQEVTDLTKALHQKGHEQAERENAKREKLLAFGNLGTLSNWLKNPEKTEQRTRNPENILFLDQRELKETLDKHRNVTRPLYSDVLKSAGIIKEPKLILADTEHPSPPFIFVWKCDKIIKLMLICIYDGDHKVDGTNMDTEWILDQKLPRELVDKAKNKWFFGDLVFPECYLLPPTPLLGELTHFCSSKQEEFIPALKEALEANPAPSLDKEVSH